MGALHVVVRSGAPVPLALPCDAAFLGANRPHRLGGLGRRLSDFSLIFPRIYRRREILPPRHPQPSAPGHSTFRGPFARLFDFLRIRLRGYRHFEFLQR